MAPAAAASNWLSFSLSPMEMLGTNSHHHHHHPQTPQIDLPTAIPAPQHQYSTFFDTFYSNDWANAKTPVLYADYGAEHTTAVPKLEDFFGGDNNTASYNSQTETTTQDDSSQLTHLYDPHHAAASYFGDHHHHQDLKSLAENGFHSAAAANSGSEVDDSGSVGRATQLSCAGSEFVGHSIDTELATGFAVAAGASAAKSSEKALVSVAVESDSPKKISDTFGQRTSIYRGVTRHRWTGRYEAHLWDNSCRREGQARKGRQVYLGGYDKEERAARAYDLAALKYWGPTATTNFPISDYTKELEEMKNVTKQEFIASLRRKSSGFSRGASIYRGVTRHHQQGRWQARIGRVAGNKDLYLGTFATEEEAAEAYDIAAIKFRGVNAVTNFEMSRYNVEAIINSNLPVGGAAKRLKLATESSDHRSALSLDQQSQSSNGSSNTSGTINFAAVQAAPSIACNVPFDTATAIFHQNLLHNLGSNGGSGGGVQVTTSESFPMGLMPQTSSEFYIWPHQSY